jgi:hypothetical protein
LPPTTSTASNSGRSGTYKELTASHSDASQWNSLGGFGVSRAKGAADGLRAVRERIPAQPTATDAWRCAEDCGLVIDEANGRRRLDDGYAIKPCPPDDKGIVEPAPDW